MSARESLGVGRFRGRIRSVRRAKDEFSLSPDEWQQIAEDYLGRLCAKDGCPNVPTPGYLLCADCAAAGGNV